LGTVTGHAVTNGFQIGISVMRVGQPVPKGFVSGLVPYHHPKGVIEAAAKQSGRALAAFKAAQSKARKAA
jgi:hypothetical protein